MPKYKVNLTQEQLHTASIWIEADDPEDAFNKASDYSATNLLDWEYNDAEPPYIEFIEDEAGHLVGVY